MHSSPLHEGLNQTIDSVLRTIIYTIDRPVPHGPTTMLFQLPPTVLPSPSFSSCESARRRQLTSSGASRAGGPAAASATRAVQTLARYRCTLQGGPAGAAVAWSVRAAPGLFQGASRPRPRGLDSLVVRRWPSSGRPATRATPQPDSQLPARLAERAEASAVCRPPGTRLRGRIQLWRRPARSCAFVHGISSPKSNAWSYSNNFMHLRPPLRGPAGRAGAAGSGAV
jgi:hypothetical protein